VPAVRLLCALLLALCALPLSAVAAPSPWTEAQRATLRSLSIDSLPAVPPDPSDRYADDPRAAALGQRLFFDPRFSATGSIACAHCHAPALQFQDGLPLAHGIGTTDRRAMPIIGAAYAPFLFWDGRKDSLWAQAMGPMESAAEHGGNRTFYAHLIARDYRAEFEAIFGELPDLAGLPPQAGPVDDPAAHGAWIGLAPDRQEAVTRIYADMGKAIEAYERTLHPHATRFDRYARAVLAGPDDRAATILTSPEIAGLGLFIGRANCTRCHNGPLFTNNDFHNTGIPAVPGQPADPGRARGAELVRADEFNCLGRYSDADVRDCAALRFMRIGDPAELGQFKPPSLRGVAERAPYMHAGQFATLPDVVAHYRRAPAAPIGHSELEPLDLTDAEAADLVAFLGSLNTEP
jgi:cytochrome c peroxidase